jgi:hypothetical protein
MTALSDFATNSSHRADLAAERRRMPAFTAIAAALESGQPLHGARIACTLPLTLAAAVLVETLQGLGARVRWAPPPFADADGRLLADTQAAGLDIRAPRGSAARHLFDWPDGAGPNLLLEHGAAASRLIHAGTRREGENGIAYGARPYSAIATAIHGTTEVAGHGVRWLARRDGRGELLYPAMNCSAIGPFGALTVEGRGLRASEALSLALLSQVELFRDATPAAGLTGPPASIARAIAGAHDDLLRSRVEKLRDMPSDAPRRDMLGAR